MFKALYVATVLTLAFAANAYGEEVSELPGAAAVEEGQPGASTETQVSPEFPKSVKLEGGTVIIHPPQIRSWENFERIEGVAAVETVPEDARAPRFGILGFSADAVPDLETRTVHLDNIVITSLKERGEEVPDAERQLIVAALPLAAREMPLDLVLSYLADGVVPESTAGIKVEPPRIIVSTTPALIVLLQGEPVLAPIGESGLAFAANTNWPLFKEEASGRWYLRNNEHWLAAGDLDAAWSWAGALPEALKNLPDDDNWRSTKVSAAAWSGAADGEPPAVFVDTKPAELILLDGEPDLVEIEELGLFYAKNTDSELFQHNKRWFYLVSGRWFTNKKLNVGDKRWSPVFELPDVFAQIPEDHEKADVLAAVPGTATASIAALDAQIPKKTEVPVDLQMPETVNYTGEPIFEPIPQTELYRATNTSYSVIQAGSEFYLCYSGMWYVSNTATGPWRVATYIPDAIYQIPASSPVYHTTYVKVYETSPVTVTYGYTSGYSSVYIVNGVPVYGTGWYYPPYYYYYGGYPVYYGYPYTYGSASFYNPRTGVYGSRSVAYGPYGGYGYSSAYNPRTGTYARAEAAWDHDDWYAAGEAYNPRTGRYYGTERHYDDDDGEWEIDSTLEGRRGDVDVSREFDDDSGRAEISTSRGGEGTFTRKESGDGWNTQGEFTTADGRTVSGSGRYEDGEGSSSVRGSGGGTGTIERSVDGGVATREGTFSKDGKTVNTETTRDGTGPRTTFETSEGGRGAVAGTGLNRTMVGESGSGDLYAARDGNVYKKSTDGWSRNSGEGWETIDMPDRASRNSSGSFDRSELQNRSSTYDRSQLQNRSSTYDRSQLQNRSSSRSDRYSSLNRDHQARQRGMSRSRDFNRSYGGRGGFSGGGRRGGGRRR